MGSRKRPAETEAEMIARLRTISEEFRKLRLQLHANRHTPIAQRASRITADGTTHVKKRPRRTP